MVKKIISDTADTNPKHCFDVEIDVSGMEWWVFKPGKGKPAFRVSYKNIIEPQLIRARKSPSVDPQ